jgi:hypothetical protein
MISFIGYRELCAVIAGPLKVQISVSCIQSYNKNKIQIANRQFFETPTPQTTTNRRWKIL